MDIVEKINWVFAISKHSKDLVGTQEMAVLSEFIDEFKAMRQQLAKPAPEAQILIDALLMAKDKLQVFRKHSDGQYQGGMEYNQLMKKIDDAIAAYDTKAKPDNGVEK